MKVRPAMLLNCYTRRIARELWWTNQDFPPAVSFHYRSPCACITWGMNNRPVGGRSSETWFHPIDINNMNEL
jgi:hypothetical protein